MANVAAVLAGLKKNMGERIGDFGTKLHESERVPTGIFAFDMATGGGWPKGKVSEVFGPESSGKTNLVLKTIATHQMLWPEEVCAILDLEHALDGEWAKKLGVDTDKLLWMKPEYVEQTIDMVEALLAASDIGLVALDSIAAMITFNEANSDADKAAVGGSSNLVGKLIRKITLRLNQAEKEGRFPTVLCVNQTRYKIGVMMGDPETTPGGNAPKFAAAMRVRTYGKNINDAKISKTMPVLKETQFIIRKWKTPILATHGMYQMVTVPHGGFTVGECQDVNAVLGYMKQCGVLEKIEGYKGGWKLMGEEYKTLDPIKKRLVEDKEWGLGIRSGVIKTMMAGGEIIEAQQEEAA